MPYLGLEFGDTEDRVTAPGIARGRQWPTKRQKWFTLSLDESLAPASLLALVDCIFAAQR